MATATTRYLVRKPDPADAVNVTTDISNPYDTWDSNLARVDDAGLATETSRWNRILKASGTVATTSGTTELDLSGLAVNSVAVKSGRTYYFSGKLYVSSPTAGDDFFIRVRKDTAGSGQELLIEPNFVSTTGLDHKFLFSGPFVATADATNNFLVSIQRAAGSGTVAIQGDRKTFFRVTVDPPTITSTVETP